MFVRSRARRVSLLLGAALALAACRGVVIPNDDGPGGDGGEGPGRSGDVEPAPSTRLPRLTHEQWERTVQSLFRLEERTGLSVGFRADPGDAAFLFDNNGGSLAVDDALWSGYQRAAATLAEQTVNDPARLEAILPPGSRDDPARFVRDFGMRAHRRPLTDAEVARYMTLYEAGPALYDGMADLEAGVRILLEAFLQSPHFLYRVEPSAEPRDGVVPLDGWEIASRLSYFLWDSMPDEELFSLAASGELEDPDVVAMQAERMLDDPRAEHVIVDFHRQLLDVDAFESIRPSDVFFPGVASHLGELAARENELFVRDEVIERGGGWYELLTSNRTFVNDDLAAVYGLEPDFGQELVPVELNPVKRAGLFTQVGFLATHATSRDPDPIHRGVFLVERVNCIQIAAPPADIPPLPEPSDGTNRQTIEELTEEPGTVCASCHGPTINPFGFPFESYDAVGQWRIEDRGHPIDSTSEPMIDDRPTPVAGALELINAMAESRAVHECYARHWVEYAFGRELGDEDRALVERLGGRSLDRASVREVLVELVSSEAFLSRSTQELP